MIGRLQGKKTISWITWWALRWCRAVRWYRWARWPWSWWPAKRCCWRSGPSYWRAWVRAGRAGRTNWEAPAPSTKWLPNLRSRTGTVTRRRYTMNRFRRSLQRRSTTSASDTVDENVRFVRVWCACVPPRSTDRPRKSLRKTHGPFIDPIVLLLLLLLFYTIFHNTKWSKSMNFHVYAPSGVTITLLSLNVFTIRLPLPVTTFYPSNRIIV